MQGDIKMLRRFRKRNMILDDVPATPADNTIYPEQMSAEYFQAIQENTIFNFLGYDDKARESYGIITLELERLTPNIEGPLTDPTLGSPDFVGVGDGRVWTGFRSIQVNLDGTVAETDGTAISANSGVGTFLGDFATAPSITTGVAESYYNTSDGKYYNHTSSQSTWNLYSDFGEYNHKIAGVDEFSAEDSYIVLLTIDQFIGVDFNAPSTGSSIVNPAQIQPLINPNNEAVSYQVSGQTLQHLSTNRHDRPVRENTRDRLTRPVFINTSVFEQDTDFFKISVSRTGVWAEVQTSSSLDDPNEGTSVVSVHDYQRLSRTDEHVIYSPTTDPDPPPAADPPVSFNRSGITSHDRSS